MRTLILGVLFVSALVAVPLAGAAVQSQTPCEGYPYGPDPGILFPGAMDHTCEGPQPPGGPSSQCPERGDIALSCWMNDGCQGPDPNNPCCDSPPDPSGWCPETNRVWRYCAVVIYDNYGVTDPPQRFCVGNDGGITVYEYPWAPFL